MNEFRMFAKDGLAVVVKDKGELWGLSLEVKGRNVGEITLTDSEILELCNDVDNVAEQLRRTRAKTFNFYCLSCDYTSRETGIREPIALHQAITCPACGEVALRCSNASE